MMTVAPEVEIVLYGQHPTEVPLSHGSWRVCLDTRSGWMPYPLWLQRRCPSLLAADGIDVFWGQNQMLPLKLRGSCFRILTIHDVTAVLFPRTMTLAGRATSRLYFRRAVRVADCILTVSQATSRLACTYLGADERRLRVIYQGCYEGFSPAPRAQARAVVAAKFGLLSDYLLTVGNIEPRKAHLDLLSALELLPNAPVLAVVGGLGWYYRPIVAALGRNERAGRVRYLGRVEDDDLASLYNAAKLTIYPSLYEGFGLPVLEAMSCGCPVLCRWSSSLPEVGGAAAAYFRGGKENLAAEIQRLLSDNARLDAMSQAGLVRAGRFGFRRAAEEVVRILREGVGQV